MLAPGASQPAHAAHRLRLIVADDRAPARRAFRALLETYADLVVIGEAADGAQAIELAERDQPDVVVLDVYMPILDGVQATARIKERWPRVRILVLSVAGEERDRAFAAGADAFIAKGAPAEMLIDSLRPSADWAAHHKSHPGWYDA